MILSSYENVISDQHPRGTYEFAMSCEGAALVIANSGKLGRVSSDGQGFHEAVGFLRAFARHYRKAISSAVKLVATLTSRAPAAELMDVVNRLVGTATCCCPPACNVGEREDVCMVASLIANCAFGMHDTVPDIDEHGDFHPEFVPCALRGVCPYNGFRRSAPRTSICNPVYDLGLQDRESQLVKLLLTGYPLADIAHILAVSESALRQRTVRLYRKLGVDGREHLRTLLQGKRVA